MFALLNVHALRKREELGLDAKEIAITKLTTNSHLISVGFGVVSLTIVAGWPRLTPLAGMLYMLLGPVQGLYGWLAGRKVDDMPAEPSNGDEAPQADPSPDDEGASDG